MISKKKRKHRNSRDFFGFLVIIFLTPKKVIDKKKQEIPYDFQKKRKNRNSRDFFGFLAITFFWHQK